MNASSEHRQKKNIIISQNQTSYLWIIVGWQGAHSKANTTWAQSTINPERTNQEKLSINFQSFQQETRQKRPGKDIWKGWVFVLQQTCTTRRWTWHFRQASTSTWWLAFMSLTFLKCKHKKEFWIHTCVNITYYDDLPMLYLKQNNSIIALK